MTASQPTNYVVAVSSVSGGGKTTLVTKTAELLQGTALYFDEYAAVSHYPADKGQWLADGADIDAWQTPQFALDLASLRRGETITTPNENRVVAPSAFIVIEDPTGRARAEMAPHIDFVAVIDTPPEIALARRLVRDMNFFDIKDIQNATREQLTKGFENLIGYVRGYLSSYLRTGQRMYQAVQEQALASCDVVLDGRLPADELATQLVALVKCRPGH